ncbi:LexA family protein [Halobacillus aidingensis]|uniref:Repressor LexA n=1 Tax=Halobacillus aidingensis TaxID=240303 RepID=A0A1H0MK92_HALAD|nr:XRE family transcriptional regulator [Halobacillus aidingensis]SDO80745.1 repressor LexA [Halobacillus aidingensis]
MFGEKLKKLRKLEGWTQEYVAKKLGVSKQTYSHYERENRTPSLKTIQKLAKIYDVDMDEIFGLKEDESVKENQSVYEVPQLAKIPIVGQISCGNGELAYEEIEGYEETPQSWLNGGEYFYLRTKGDSMSGARINEGDLVLIRQQPDVEDGEIAAVLLDDEAVLKRVYKRENTYILQSENPAYPPRFISKDLKILGKLKKIVINV